MNTDAPIPPNTTNDYLSTFGLQQHPYLDSNDAHFFYADPALIQRLDLLQHLTQFGDMLLGVTGGPGSGKSTLVQQFLQRSNNTTWRSCSLSAKQLQHPADLLAYLAACLGVRDVNAPERLKADLVRHCQSLRQNSQLPVVIIDDAQLLPDPVLSTLLGLADDDAHATLKLLRIILFSEPGLEQRLSALGLHNAIRPLLHCLDIPRFDAHQTTAYLMYRLAAAGYSGESPFSLTEIRALHKSTQGVPALLNIQAHELLLEHAGRAAAARKVAKPSSRRRFPPAVALGLIGGLAAIGYTWYLNQGQVSPESIALVKPEPAGNDAAEELVPSDTPNKEPGELLEPTLENTQQHDKNEIKSKMAANTPATTPSSPPTEDTTQPADATPDLKAAPETETTAVAPTPETPATKEQLEVSPPAVTAPDPESAPTAQAGDSPTKPETPITEAPVQVVSSPDKTEQTRSVTVDIPTVKPSPSESTSAPVAAAPDVIDKPAITPPSPAAAPEQSTVTKTPPPSTKALAKATTAQLGTEWLQSRPASHFTLQLLGGRSEKSLREYLRQNRIPEPVATFRTTFKGGDWYVLIHGDFPTMTAARAAVDSLPQNVRKSKPWARSFASVNADIEKARP